MCILQIKCLSIKGRITNICLLQNFIPLAFTLRGVTHQSLPHVHDEVEGINMREREITVEEEHTMHVGDEHNVSGKKEKKKKKKK